MYIYLLYLLAALLIGGVEIFKLPYGSKFFKCCMLVEMTITCDKPHFDILAVQRVIHSASKAAHIDNFSHHHCFITIPEGKVSSKSLPRK